MIDVSVLNVGDVVVEVPAYVGQQVSGQKFTVIATYKNANGFWHVAETTDTNGLVVQVPLSDGGPYLHRVQEATIKPVDRPVEAPRVNPSHTDWEALRSVCESALGPVAKMFLAEARKRKD